MERKPLQMGSYWQPRDATCNGIARDLETERLVIVDKFHNYVIVAVSAHFM